MKTRHCLTGLLLCLMLCMLSWTASAVTQEGFYTEMPRLLRMTQTMETEKIVDNVQIRRTYPDTVNDAVNAAVRATVDRLASKGRAFLPSKRQQMLCDLDVGSTVFRTGTSWMSFLTIASYAEGKQQIAVDFESHVYDTKTGEEITLLHVFAPDSPAWGIIAEAARTQLTAYFPDEACDPDRLEKLLEPENLAATPFVMSGAKLMLTWRADALYEGKSTLMHVNLYYRDVRSMMTERAAAQTDNSMFRKIALTFDDGPAEHSTRAVLNALRTYGGAATFFCVGMRLDDNAFNLCREHDEGHAVASHTWYHKTKGAYTAAEHHAWKEKFDAALSRIIGLKTTYMRAPGGQDDIFIGVKIGLPLIHWSLFGGDTDHSGDARKWARKIVSSARNGDIVLMHDLNAKAGDEARRVLEGLTDAGFLCVTVEELYADAGLTLIPDYAHYGPRMELYEAGNEL